MITAAVKNYIIDQGSEWRRSIRLQQPSGDPVDLTGCTARMQIRRAVEGEIIAELTTDNGRLVIDEAAGRISMHIPSAVTDAFTTDGLLVDRITEGSKTKTGPVAVYDLEVLFPTDTDPDVYRFLEGRMLINAQVTK